MSYLVRKGRHCRPRSRQARAASLALAVTALLVLAGMAASAAELGAHGYAVFAYRPAGTGATRNDGHAPPPPSPPARAPVIVGVTAIMVPGLARQRTAEAVIRVRPGEVILILPRKGPP